MMSEFVFNRPEEAPTFYPTEEEFTDPLGYISKIRPEGERFGICKIKPPPSWSPPFALEVDKFRFNPRVQKINELEAITRIKINFLDQISKFWELQGTSLRIPLVGTKSLDLYTLHQLVKSSDWNTKELSEDLKWHRIATRLGLQSNGKVKVGSLLKAHYDKILGPYEMWKSNQDKKKASSSNVVQESQQKIVAVGKRRKSLGVRTRGTKRKSFDHANGTNKCRKCEGGIAQNKMLVCRDCNDKYHTSCIKSTLVLRDVKVGEWHCPDCLEKELRPPKERFGFVQATRTYSLKEFGLMADRFKANHFKTSVNKKIASATVEKEFWRIVSAIDENVVVEYGADLYTSNHNSSGFPTETNPARDPGGKYTSSGWNLNNLPALKESVFTHIGTEISGFTIPWMYAGMCFSTFCWHNEDHWSYSINYLHWGETKTWYGVPGGRADDFEKAMKSAAPDLFAQSPDLLHQLVTIMNPNILMEANVPVYRMDQEAGEFMITFPRAYHAGFNQGYNLAEAVNFAPADWITMGRECVSHYSQVKRFCVFSHDELICTMASTPEKLEHPKVVATYKDMQKMFEAEKEQRKYILAWGVKKRERIKFEELADDERQCYFCKTTLYLSAVACGYSKHAGLAGSNHTKFLCMKHYDETGCKGCENKNRPRSHTFKFRYKLEELQEMMKVLRRLTEKYDKWIKKVTDALVLKSLSLEELQTLVEEANERGYPRTELLVNAETILNEAEKASKLAKKLLEPPAVQTRSHSNASDFILKCSILELTMMGKWLHNVTRDNDVEPVRMAEYISALIEVGNNFYWNEDREKRIEEFCLLCKKAYELKDLSPKESRSKEVEQLLKNSEDIPLPGHPRENKLNMKNPLPKVQNRKLPFLGDLASIVDTGKDLVTQMKHMATLRSQIAAANSWRENCRKIFLRKNSTIELIEALVPRREIPQIPQRGRKSLVLADGPSLTLIANLLGLPPEDVKSETALIGAYSRSIRMEVEAMRELRRINQNKLASQDGQFCLCQKPKEGFMIRCELCLEWYHPSCVPLSKGSSEDSPSADVSTQAMLIYEFVSGQKKYLGPCCCRSKRPDYKIVFELFAGLNIVPLGMIEGVAIMCFSNRVMKWQEQCDKFMQIPEVKDVVELLVSNTSSSTSSLVDPTRNFEAQSSPEKDFANSSLQFDWAYFQDLGKTLTSQSHKTEVEIVTASELENFCLPALQDEWVPDELSVTMNSNNFKVSPKPMEQIGTLQGDTLDDLMTNFLLNPVILDKIESLLVEIDLMEISTVESEVLWKLYSLAKPMMCEFRDPKEIQTIIQSEISSQALGVTGRRKQETRKRKGTLSVERRKRMKKQL